MTTETAEQGGRDLTPEEERNMDHLIQVHRLHSRPCRACAGAGCSACSGMGELYFVALNQPCGPFCPLTFRSN